MLLPVTSNLGISSYKFGPVFVPPRAPTTSVHNDCLSTPPIPEKTNSLSSSLSFGSILAPGHTTPHIANSIFSILTQLQLPMNHHLLENLGSQLNQNLVAHLVLGSLSHWLKTLNVIFCIQVKKRTNYPTSKFERLKEIPLEMF